MDDSREELRKAWRRAEAEEQSRRTAEQHRRHVRVGKGTQRIAELDNPTLFRVLSRFEQDGRLKKQRRKMRQIRNELRWRGFAV